MQWQEAANQITLRDDDGTLVGEITFPTVNESQHRVVVERTFVNPAYRGQGIAAQLVEHFVAYADQHHYQVKLMCPYAQDQFDRHPEYQHLLVSPTN